MAISAQTTAIAAEFDSPGAVERVDGGADTEDGVYLPAGRIGDDGEAATVVGVTPADAARVRSTTGVQLPGPPETGLSRGSIDAATEIEIAGSSPTATIPVSVRANQRTLVPPDWYVGNESAVRTFGGTGGYVLYSGDGSGRTSATPLRGALPFFITATAGLRQLLLATAVGVGVLTGGIVYSVTRMTVRDRVQAIRVIRATGGTKRRVVGDFMARSALLVGVGIALGYAVGLIGSNAAVNIAIYAGLPTSLTVSATGVAASILLGGYAIVFAIAVVAGGLATRPVLRAEPAHIGGDDHAGGRGGRLAPTLLDWRVVWPAASALTVFVAAVLLLAAAGGALGPLVSGSGQTVSEPTAVHPVASSVPASYAGVFESAGVQASPEILAFSVLDDRAVLVRGAEYDRFAPVSDATMVEGQEPTGRDEAVVGADLAASLGIDVGDTVTVGGSTTPAFTTVKIVGRYEASGYHDDQLLVSLPTARHLTNKQPGDVHFVRLDEAIGGEDSTRVVDVTSPSRVAVGGPVAVNVTVLNPTSTEQTVTVPARLGSTETTLSATVGPSSEATLTWRPQAQRTGETQLRAGDESRTVTVLPQDAVTVSGLPERVPPNATLQVHVQTLEGGPANATLTVDERSTRTGADGVALLSFSREGTRTLTVQRGSYESQVDVVVSENATRALTYRWESSSSITPLTQARPTLVVDNPWNRTVTETVTSSGPGEVRSVSVALAPGASRRIGLDFGRLSPGQYELAAEAHGELVATQSLTVRGDRRLASAIAARSGSASGGTGIGTAIATVFGNVQVIFAVVLGFAAAMSIAGTSAAFAYDVDRNAYAIGLYRTVGATRAQVLRILVADALRIGIGATGLAMIFGSVSVLGVHETGILRLFGVSIAPQFTLQWVGLTLGACLVLTVVGTVLAAVPALRAEPRTLLDRGDGS
ncbi:FtsX-like permease family protein [Haloarchaeobius iranensis]|nr:FtsX-like permease family protein [Haloarchaeobius iranensis]